MREKRAKFNEGIQELADILEAKRQEADGNNIDTEKLDALNTQIKSFIAQLNGEETEARETVDQREPSPFDPNYEEKTAATVIGKELPVVEQTTRMGQTDVLPSSPFN